MLINPNCFDCRIELEPKDQYLVKDEIWEEAIERGRKSLIVGDEKKIDLCKSCLEKRIERSLNKLDFKKESVKDNKEINIH